jgi:uncharacterized YkwD family protein
VAREKQKNFSGGLQMKKQLLSSLAAITLLFTSGNAIANAATYKKPVKVVKTTVVKYKYCKSKKLMIKLYSNKKVKKYCVAVKPVKKVVKKPTAPVTKPSTPVVTKPTAPVTTTPKAPVVTQPTTPVAETPTTVSAYEKQVFDLTNVERAKAGLKPLVLDAKLSSVARTKSQDMHDKKYFSHTSPTYGSPFDMMKKFGITYSWAAENIAQGQRTPQEVVTAWMNSVGHRANILSPKATTLGVGYVADGNYWTQMFIAK